MIEIGEIRVDDGVPVNRPAPRKRNRPYRNPTVIKVLEKFAEMTPGQSFFVPGATKRDLDFLRRPLTREGFGYTMRYVECDEIYQTSGVRVWRQHGEYDEL